MTEPVTLDPLELSDEEFAALQSPTDTTQGASQQSEETTNESEISTEDPIQSKEASEADQETETEESEIRQVLLPVLMFLTPYLEMTEKPQKKHKRRNPRIAQKENPQMFRW